MLCSWILYRFGCHLTVVWLLLKYCICMLMPAVTSRLRVIVSYSHIPLA